MTPEAPPQLPVEPVRPGEEPAAGGPLDGVTDAMVLRGGISLGKPFGIPVRASLLSVLLYYVLADTTLGRMATDSGHSANTAAGVSLLGAVLFELSVFLHEIGHCVVAKRLGLTVVGLRLWVLGGITQVEVEKESPRREYAVAVVGPLVSLLLGGVCVAAGLLLHEQSGNLAGIVVFWTGAVNAILAGYNLIPGLPFDGGRVLRAAVWGATGRPLAGTKAAAVMGYVAAAATAFASLQVPADTSNTDAAATVLPGLLIAGYIGLNAGQALRAAKVAERAPLVSAGALARRAFSAAADLPLAEALRRATAIGATSLIVTSTDGRPQSLVSGAQVDGVPADRRPWVTVSSVSHPITEGMVLDARLAGQAVLDALRRHPATEYLVVEPAGKILGVLAAIDVAAVLDPTVAHRPAAAGIRR